MRNASFISIALISILLTACGVNQDKTAISAPSANTTATEANELPSANDAPTPVPNGSSDTSNSISSNDNKIPVTVSSESSPIINLTGANYFGMSGQLHEITYNGNVIHDFVPIQNHPDAVKELIDSNHFPDGKFHRTMENYYTDTQDTQVLQVESDLVYMNNSLDLNGYVILPGIPRLEEQWSYEANGVQYDNQITGLAKVITPAGTFDNCLTVEVTTSSSNGTSKNIEYFAPGVGLVCINSLDGRKPKPFEYAISIQNAVPENQFPK